MHRYYRMDVQPDLFGEWCLMREWGRIGSAGQTRHSPSLPRARRKQRLRNNASLRSDRDTQVSHPPSSIRRAEILWMCSSSRRTVGNDRDCHFYAIFVIWLNPNPVRFKEQFDPTFHVLFVVAWADHDSSER